MSGADHYCVFGNPVGHSKSPEIHAAFAAATGQQLRYERRLAPLDGFAAALRRFVDEGGRGANVTVPFKLEACALADTLTARARAAGAVNTLSFADGRIVGDNTDGAGLVRDIVGNAGVAIAGRRVLLLGAGGAARGALLPLLGERPAQLLIANRSRAGADALVALLDEHGGAQGQGPEQGQGPAPCQGQDAGHGHAVVACTLAELDRLAEAGPFDIVVNATSASLDGARPALPAALLGPGTLALDMMYGAAPTVFLRWAAAQGAQPRDGLGMLVEQAAEAFAVWRGVRPVTAALLARLRAAL